MREHLGERIDVLAYFKTGKGVSIPMAFRYHNRKFVVKRLGKYYRIKEGRFVNHFYAVDDGANHFVLKLNADSLQWTVEEVFDGNAA